MYVPFRSHGVLIGAVCTFDMITQVEMCSKKFIVIVDDSKLSAYR